MAFHISTSDLPRLMSYDEARNRFHSTTMVRGEHKAYRRLGDRKMENKWLMQEMIDGVEVYVAGLHSTGLIYYYPTHYEITIGNWDTISTRKFLEKVIMADIKHYSRDSYVPRGFNPPSEPNISKFFNGYGIQTGMHRYKFNYYTHKAVDESVHIEVKKYKINRKRMNEVRKPYQKFFDYLKTMHGLTNGEVPEKPPEFTIRNNRSEILNMAREEKSWWNLYMLLANHMSRMDWQLNKSYVKNYKDMVQYMDVEIKFNHPEVLDVVY